MQIEHIEFENYVFEGHIVGDNFVKECFGKLFEEQRTRSIAYDMRNKGFSYSLMAYLVCNYRKEALSVGFEDSNYFARVFKKHMGVSPREYRKVK